MTPDRNARAGGDAAILDALSDAIDGVLAREEWDCSLPHKCAAAAMAIFDAPTGWQPIATAPDDFDRPGGQRSLKLQEAQGVEFVGRRALFSNSGWREVHTNREIWPTHWCALPAPPEVTP